MYVRLPRRKVGRLTNGKFFYVLRYYGGWVAPQIYFLGFAGVVKFGNIRIGGLSGIYKRNHYYSGIILITHRQFSKIHIAGE